MPWPRQLEGWLALPGNRLKHRRQHPQSSAYNCRFSILDGQNVQRGGAGADLTASPRRSAAQLAGVFLATQVIHCSTPQRPPRAFNQALNGPGRHGPARPANPPCDRCPLCRGTRCLQLPGRSQLLTP